jgi:hypothetical protein
MSTRLVGLVMSVSTAVVVSLAGCSPIAMSSPSVTVTMSVALQFENRGGPDLEVSVNGHQILAIPCNSAPTLVPGVNGVPQLPWDVSVSTASGGVVVYTARITTLPAWFLQIGNDVLGIGTSPPSGPAGPTCPPTAS